MNEDTPLREMFRRLAEALPEQPMLVDSVMRRIESSSLLPRRRKTKRWLMGATLATATLLAVLGLIFFPAASSSTNLLAEVFQAFDNTPAYHFQITFHTSTTSEKTDDPQSEIWVVRGVGRREENRRAEKLVSLATDNLRWLLYWDLAAKHVIASPSRMANPKYGQIEDNAFMVSREKCLQWGERHKATIQLEREHLNGREVEKTTLSWPGGLVEDRIILWFDPQTRQPLKVYMKNFGPHDVKTEIEMLIDYPDPKSIPAERFLLQTPREARLEIEDPQLGRQIYSEGRLGPWLGQ